MSQSNNDSNFSTISTEDLEINAQFRYAFDIIEKQNKNAFITGKAGTGKSTLLRYIVENTEKQTAILAPTGLSAVNIGGATIHSYFNFPIEPLHKEDIKKTSNKEIYQNINCIVIDEISMVRADLFDNIDQFLRINRPYPFLPFGGVQIILFGDPYQLAPIIATKAEAEDIAQRYESPWFFDSEGFRNGDFEIIQLSKVYRQKDEDYINLLDKIRKGDYETDDLEKLNICTKKVFSLQDQPIFLTTTNRLANYKNEKELAKLPDKEKVFIGEIEGKFNRKNLPTLLELKLKEGAQIMMVKNDFDKRWVNGTIGRISKIDHQEINIEIIKKGVSFQYSVEPVIWENRKYTFDYRKRKVISEVIGTFKQYPLRLAWAITINKSQGLTFNKVGIHLGNGAFSNGQTYVALSRCTNMEGLKLFTPITKSDIKVDFHMRNWMNRVLAETT